MAIFNELLDDHRMEDPEEREAENLRRGKKKTGKRKRSKSSSVSAKTYIVTITILRALIVLIVLGVSAALIYYLIMLFIP